MTAPVFYNVGDFPPRDLDWGRLVPHIGRARAALAGYRGLVSAIPNSAVLLSPLITQEAALSSRIEGTMATMGEVLEVDAGGKPPGMTETKKGDIEEILNYRTAMRMCTGAIRDRPLSQHLLREAHQLLMTGVRGHNKSPGSFREEQNWIGAAGCSIENASYIPVPQEHLQSSLDAWESYMIQDDVPDPLVQLAILHVEFEAIHPFKDGNGRVGRMLIPLFLFAKGLLPGPDFYISAYLDAHREEYIDRLRAVSSRRDWSGWIAFFLTAMARQAEDNERKAREILALYGRTVNTVVQITHSQHSPRAVDFLFTAPIFKSTDFEQVAGIPTPTARRILRLLRAENIVDTVREPSGRSPGFYLFRELLDIADGNDAV